ncbi:MAG: MarR family winged helix-turn-helix transcriptional regulator [Oscillospiraceae bacterium]
MPPSTESGAAEAALGLKSRHYASYLMGISRLPGNFQEQLARRIYQNKSSVARQLAVLEEAGFVRRVCCDSDRRVTELYPTRAGGAALAEEIRQVLGQWESWVTQDLPRRSGAVWSCSWGS